MNIDSLIVNIKCMEDINNITSNTKYINLNIDSVTNNVIDYFLINGSNYLYSDTTNDINNYIYASYDIFKYGESIIDNIIDLMPSNLNLIEKVRYIYISIGKILSIDINILEDKNDILSFNNINIVNNIWSSIKSRKVDDKLVNKIFMYICNRVGIKCELINNSNNIVCKVYIDNSSLIIDLVSDIYNIQGGFSTKYFDKYNDNKEIDRKILYIKDEYNDYYIDKVLSDIDYTRDDMLETVLSLTSSIININNIGSYELYKIYREIFNKNLSCYDIRVNNLFIYEGLSSRKHFVMFSYGDKYYCYNYNKRCFTCIDISIIYNNNKFGIYCDEDFDVREGSVVL